MQISCHFLCRALCNLTFLSPRADVASFPLRFRGLGYLHLWQSIQPLCVTTDPFTSSAQLYNLSWPGLSLLTFENIRTHQGHLMVPKRLPGILMVLYGEMGNHEILSSDEGLQPVEDVLTKAKCDSY